MQSAQLALFIKTGEKYMQPRSQDLFPGLGVGREKALGSASESFILIG